MLDLYRRSGGNEFPDFVYLLVGEGDAAIGPVDATLKRPEPAKAVLDSVDHDVAAGCYAQIFCVELVFSIRIGDVQREVKPAVSVLCVNGVKALWSFMVAVALLWLSVAATESYAIGPQDRALGIQGHGVGRFLHNDMVRQLSGGGSRRYGTSDQQQK